MKNEELDILSVFGKIGDFYVNIGLSAGGRWDVFVSGMRMTSCDRLISAIKYVNEKGWRNSLAEIVESEEVIGK